MVLFGMLIYSRQSIRVSDTLKIDEGGSESWPMRKFKTYLLAEICEHVTSLITLSKFFKFKLQTKPELKLLTISIKHHPIFIYS